MDNKIKNGAIIGAGISGLSAGIFAQRRGLKIPIYEKNKSFNNTHHLLWLAPNGLRLLNTMGLFDQVKALSVAQRSMEFSTKNLKTLMSLNGQQLTQSCQFPIMAIKRQDLLQILMNEFLRGGGEIFYEQELTHLSVENKKVFLYFNNQSSADIYSFVIAADGMGSSVRSQLFPDSKVKYQGIRTWLGESESPVAPAYVGNTIETWGNGTRFVLTSLDGRTVYWSALERAQQYEKNSSEIPKTICADLAKLFSSYHPDICKVLASADPARIKRCNFGVVSGLSSYHHETVVLIGDAAHGMPPNMGNGASLGLEDALSVIHQITSGNNLEQSFVLYEKFARPRARALIGIANSMNVLFQPKSQWAGKIRDTIANLVPDKLTQMRMEKLYNLPVPGGNKVWI